MHVRVLGHAELCGGDAPGVTGAKPRAVLTYLGLHVGEVVTANVLVDLLWGEAPPRTADRSVQTHISTLRRSVGADAVVRRGDGWQLEVGSIDVIDFTSAIRHGKEAQRAGHPEEAAALYDAALALWRGAPVLPGTARGEAEVTRWTETHDGLVEDRADALLASGEAAGIVADLEAAVAEAPLRERRWAQLMLALYRSDRQADALRAYQRLRSVLGEELGLEPSAELQRLERRMVMQDESLKRPSPVVAADTDTATGPGRARRERPPVADFSRRMVVGATEPMAIMAAGGGAAAGVAVGGGIGGAVALAGVGWALAVVLPAARRGRRDDPGPVGPTDLREPWRQFVTQAQDAQRRFTATVASVPAGPIHDRLQRLGERIGHGVQEAGRVARRGQSLDDVRRDIDTFRIERQLDELEHEAPEPTVSRLRTADALRAQLATADRLDRILTATHDRLRFLAAHLGEAVARSFELSVETDGAAPIGEVDESLGDVIEEMEVLRQALDDTDLPGRTTA